MSFRVASVFDPFELRYWYDYLSDKPPVWSVTHNEPYRWYYGNDLDVLIPLLRSIESRAGLEMGRPVKGMMFSATHPWTVHVDVVPYEGCKQILLPMNLDVGDGYQWFKNPSRFPDSKFFVFDQKYCGSLVNSTFRLKKTSDKLIANYHVESANSQGKIPRLVDYGDLQPLSGEVFSQDLYDKHLTHNHKEWLEGLSVEKMYSWIPGDVIVFSAGQVHCSGNWKGGPIANKLGIMIQAQYTQ